MPKSGNFIRILALAALTALIAVAAVGTAGASPAKHSDTTISGAGSTFVSPLVTTWIPAVGSQLGYTLQYNPIGSSGGINAITGRTVDFGASDAPLSPDQFNACNGCVQIPWALAATSVMYNLPGVKNLLHMDGPTLAKIFMGQITTWDDPAIKKLNKGVNLPSTKITIAHRSDGSGTTYNFTDYLARGQPRVEVAGRHRNERQLARRRRRPRKRRRLRTRRADRGHDRLRRRRLRPEEPLQLLRDEEQLRQVRDAGSREASSRPR